MKHSDALETYRNKRDFSRTPEPEGKAVRAAKPNGKGSRLCFTIQKHNASRLHYDFRLELDGVLKSWAVTKGPSLDPSDKRLAVRTEDHPRDYAEFEGVIPEGYGAGTVMLWDSGEWIPHGDPHEGLKEGILKFDLKGQRLKGGWALVLMKSRSSGNRQNWLLVKERDEHANEDDPRETWQNSVSTGRSFKQIEQESARRDANTSDKRKGHVRFPEFIKPQLAKLRDRPPEGDEWIHELKFDGYRLQALLAGGEVRLVTRNGKDWTERYPDVATALSQLGVDDAAIDGELVALDDAGRSRFSRLQAFTNDGTNTRLAFFAFDLLWLNGKNFTQKDLVGRKKALRKIIPDDDDVIRFSDHIDGSGHQVIEKACNMRLEGIVSKKKSAVYRSGRGTSWIKSKCVGRDEFVIGGYRRSEKKDRAFASLLLGEYEEGKLIYRGRVGTGFDQSLMERLAETLSPLERKTPPFSRLTSDAKRGAVWVSPRLVAEIAYTERTDDGLLRHPSFLGLREDKPAQEVKTDMEKTEEAEQSHPGAILGVRLTHPDRIAYEEQGATKREIAEYMAQVASLILPHIRNRPVSLVRCPSGASGKCFFQKHHTDSIPDEIGMTSIKESDGKSASYLLINTPEALVAAAQVGALELHIWGARVDNLEKPDRLVIDLDPDESLDFSSVKNAAKQVRDVLESAGLRSYCLLTGGKGIHVVTPLQRRHDWATVKTAAKGLAEQLAHAEPDTFVAQASKAKRRGRIFIDWLRNERGATAVCPYSLRAKSGAPIATPIRWDELSRISTAQQYNLSNISRRLSQLGKAPWDTHDSTHQTLSQSVVKLLSGNASG